MNSLAMRLSRSACMAHGARAFSAFVNALRHRPAMLLAAGACFLFLGLATARAASPPPPVYRQDNWTPVSIPAQFAHPGDIVPVIAAKRASIPFTVPVLGFADVVLYCTASPPAFTEDELLAYVPPNLGSKETVFTNIPRSRGACIEYNASNRLSACRVSGRHQPGALQHARSVQGQRHGLQGPAGTLRVPICGLHLGCACQELRALPRPQSRCTREVSRQWQSHLPADRC